MASMIAVRPSPKTTPEKKSARPSSTPNNKERMRYAKFRQQVYLSVPEWLKLAARLLSGYD